MFCHIKEVYQFFQDRRSLGIKLGLSRMDQMLDALDHPEKQIRAVHVAGTNGKGSTLTYMKEALKQNGYKVGTYTSPSIDKINDHFHINDEVMSDTSLIDCMNQLAPVINGLDVTGDPPTEYEIIFMLAIVYFADVVDIAIIETNMGGTDDSTNCIEPCLSIITNIGMDHAPFLGNSYEQIARHKAGIIKGGVSIISGVAQPEAREVIKQEAEIKNAPIFELNREFRIVDRKLTTEKQESFTFLSGNQKLVDVILAMKGEHQVGNAALACMGLEKLKEQGLTLVDKITIAAFGTAVIRGRFEQVHDNPTVIVDGAHNQEGVTAFLSTVERYYPSQKKALLFAAFRDKPIKEMLTALTSDFDMVTASSFNHPRSATVEDLMQASGKEIVVTDDWKLTLQSFLADQTNKETILFVTGSLHFIGLIRKNLEKK
ncbi:bifunctional folylpolyglutamate synthase/dihydrofolate synthase [Radiobacillus sp. PE A8.2]|uniref:bifunctional folylpolyglutamate synthase/dihydrofolate synthase n=1 Tax=Radiobacillus sp. PE A8.2 TaxID=3380349 RepID=UPI00389057F8